MKILIVGGGGREHALAWHLAQSPVAHELYMAPGNPGMAALGQTLDIAVSDLTGLAIFAAREKIDLTIVGPEGPLARGIVDHFQRAGLTIFGPSQAAARLEADKAYAKSLMVQANVPTARYRFCNQEADAVAALADFHAPYVIKENGLAAGKGVTIAQNEDEARAAIHKAFHKGMSVVIEDFLRGREVSVLAICDGLCAIPMVAAQDFKKAYDGDAGPNTGGMGSYAPVPFVDDALMQRIQREVLDPMITILREEEGVRYRGVLYAGLMIQHNGDPCVVEFNARFGDPETQVILPLLESDLADMLLCSATGDLSPYADTGFDFSGCSAVSVVLASEGYPGEVTLGATIDIPAALPPETLLFHAGTKRLPNRTIVTSGGRALNAVGLGSNLQEARDRAYQLADAVNFAGKHARRDIAANVAPAPQPEHAY
ncbi:MAG: phosphoribosylamine--glycine ligase [Vampirovibrionales bacterium]|nr:phosphoribosylamine--glycine ligase [Vampirovibrionales bacterium]